MNPRLASRVLTAAFGVAVVVAVISRALQLPLDHDEHQFVASGTLIVREGLVPYRDFPYYHLPYLSYIYAGLFLFTDRLLLAARLFCCGAALLTVYCVWRHARAAARELPYLAATGAAALFALVLVTNPLFMYTTGRSWNHDLAVLLALAATLLIGGLSSSPQPRHVAFAAGLLAGLAAGSRSTMVLMIPPIVAVAWLESGDASRARSWRMPAACCLGAGAALAPLLIFFVLSPDGFLHGNLDYNLKYNPRYRSEMGYDIAMTFAQKIGFLRDTILANPRNAALTFAYLVSSLCAVGRRGAGRTATCALAIAMALPFLAVSALAPTPTWDQYYYALVPFMTAGIIANVAAARSRVRTAIAVLATLPLLAGAVTGVRHYVPFLPFIGVSPREEWTAIRVHDVGQRIADSVGSGRVLTLGPIFPLEGGAAIYPALTTGAFEWRTTRFASAEQHARRRLLGPDDLPSLDDDPSLAAFLTGVERDPAENLEAGILEYAGRRGWVPNAIDDTLTLWRPRTD